MRKPNPETLALAVALIGTLSVLLIFLADLVVSRQRDLDTGERRLQHFAIMMGEHTARAFDAVDILLRETATDLSKNWRDWERWEPTRGWEYVAQRHSRAMPQLHDLIIFGRQGEQRFIASVFPSPLVNVRDRPYFTALEMGAEKASFGPFVDRGSARYVYGLSRRIGGEANRFSGVLLGTIDPLYLQEFCWPNRLSDDFETVLINARRQVIASCRPIDLSRQSSILGAAAEQVLFDGRLRGQIPASGVQRSRNLMIAVSPVPGFPDLSILSVVPQSTLLANWRARLLELGTLGLLVTAVLLVGGLLIRRQVREMAAITGELAASHEHLEQRVVEATRELAGEKDAAERASTAKSRFLAAASHDLRQPLHALSLFAADLQRQVRSGRSSDLPRLAEQLSTSAALLGEMLDALLDVSRLDVSGIKPDIRPFALAPIFRRLEESCRRNAADRGQLLRFRPTACWLDSDAVMVERMIGNLVSNAMRYTPVGGRILVAARRRGERVWIEVRDSGIGIAAEHQAEVFTEFYQVGNAAREQNKGLGLGLSIVDRLARALEIKVSLQSRQGEGTTFRLDVPAGTPLPAAGKLPETLGCIHGIGDSPELRECLSLAGNWGYAVTRDERAELALPPPDALLIVDAGVLVKAGLQLPAGRPLIVLVRESGAALPDHAHELLLPLRPAKLRALVAQLQKALAKSIP